MKKVVYTWYLFSWLSTTKMTKCKQWKWHQTRFCPCAPDLQKHWAEHMILMSDHNSVWWSIVGQGPEMVGVEHQVVQILSNPSKTKFQKWQNLPLATHEKVVYTCYLFDDCQPPKWPSANNGNCNKHGFAHVHQIFKTLGRAYDLDVWPQLSLMVHSRPRVQNGRCWATGCTDPV